MRSETVIYRSPDAENVYCYSPGVTVLPSGRLVATMDLGGDGVSEMSGPKNSRAGGQKYGKGKVFVSDDGGSTWRHVIDFPFWHARPFVLNGSLYIIGHAGDLMIIKSEDNGERWSEVSQLTSGEKWHAAPCNVLDDGDHLYLCMERRYYIDEIKGWNVAGLAPTLLCLDKSADPLLSNSWSKSAPIIFKDIIDQRSLDLFGVPFYLTPENFNVEISQGRFNSPMGWLEGNVVKFNDPEHIWYDPEGNTFHIILRAHTGGVGYSCLITVRKDKDGAMVPTLEAVPSGKKIVFSPMPGGHLKFFIEYDPDTKLYWMLSSQATDSMRTLSSLNNTDRYGLPNNERHRVQLLYSKNCIDWCFAKYISVQKGELTSRNYPSLVIDGDDMHVVLRGGDGSNTDAQYSNCIYHTVVRDFRDLII
ncbi:MAG: glycoside hydrolase [Pseudomonadales bacterium]|nr:glycoside hydrolase [Pseudomonadales bacterium]